MLQANRERTKIKNGVSRVLPKPREGHTASSGVKTCTLHLSLGTAPHQDVPVCEVPDVTEVTDGVFFFLFCGWENECIGCLLPLVDDNENPPACLKNINI